MDHITYYFSGGIIQLPVRDYIHTAATENSCGWITHLPRIHSGTRKGPALDRLNQAHYSHIYRDDLAE